MPGWTMVNGVWREMWGSRSKVNDIVRDTNIYCNINGVTRVIHERELLEGSVIGFRLVYTRNKSKRHFLLPHLSYNPNLPTTIAVVGATHEMDTSEKGVIFHYNAKDYDEEGILMYEGRLYAVLNDGNLVDVIQSRPDPGTDEPIDAGPIGVAWVTNRIMTLSIKIEARLTYEGYGFAVFGWNSMFRQEQTLPDRNESANVPDKNLGMLNSYDILPIERRVDDFYTVASIGIARDTHDADNHMIGSHGFLSQTIERIWVNDEMKPFIVEVYD